MADNLAITQGAGTLVAADELPGSVMVQRVKVMVGSDGSATDVSSVAPMPVSAQGFSVTTTITRPNDILAYAAGDVLGASAAAIQFSSVAPAATVIEINGVRLEADFNTIPSGQTTFRLHLYSSTPGSALANNAAFDLPIGDRASYLGFIDIPALIDLGATLYVEVNNINKLVKTASANLFGYLVTNGGFTPAAVSEVYKVTLLTRVV